MERVPDYNDLYDEYEAEQEASEKRNGRRVIGERAVFPTCSVCGEEITDEFLYEVDGEIICRECFDWNHLKKTEDFIRMEKIYD